MNFYKNLFLSQSYSDSYDEYQCSLKKADYPVWDYVVITASNETQAKAYEQQISYRLSNNYLNPRTKYKVISDPDGKRVGSGGACLNVLKYIAEDSKKTDFSGLKILCIHSGGDSKRVPQYSACGKLFSPIPRELSDGRRPTLFDEFIFATTAIPSRMKDGMLTASGDVLLLLNPLQLDFHTVGSAVLSVKEKVEVGKNHGVFLSDENGYVTNFLHKQTEEALKKAGAVDQKGNVDIDTGACIFSSEILADLYSLIDTKEKFGKFVNERARLSFYGDFQYPLAANSTEEQFYKEAPEGEFTPELSECRRVLWKILRKYPMKILHFSPASFIHFGTTHELLALMTTNIEGFKFLGWSSKVNTNADDERFSASNSYISKKNVSVGRGTYIEDSIVHANSTIGKNCVLSCVELYGHIVPDNTAIHGLKLTDGRYVVRMYDIFDNPKENKWMGKTLDTPLWTAKLFKPCDTLEEALTATLSGDNNGELLSLEESFNLADVTAILPWQKKLGDRLKVERLLDIARGKKHINMAKRLFSNGISEGVKNRLLEIAKDLSFSEQVRVYYYLGTICEGVEGERILNECFASIRNGLLSAAKEKLNKYKNMTIKKDEVTVRLPVRVNFGGGWSDTPPYCNEHGGTVLNAAITINGRYPVEIKLKRLDEYKVILESADNNSYGEFTELSELQDLGNPHDPFALHKAALTACGIVSERSDESLSDILSRLGGGIYLSTKVINIPKGSGLGTSSILSAACVKGIFEFIGIDISDNEIYNRVLCLEQFMSTGGGWQDQVGGVARGIKICTSQPGLHQDILCTTLAMSDEIKKELNERFCIIYTGQRRLARNLLREVVGKYLSSDEDVLTVLYEIQRLAVLMRFELEKGNINGFAKLLNSHWELSKKLDAGCTNTCIDQIFNTIDDLIDGKMICGAGGGGFLQVVLKENVSVETLRNRVYDVFADSGIDVWTCEFCE